jgi:gastrin-releasing peptide receptor
LKNKLKKINKKKRKMVIYSDINSTNITSENNSLIDYIPYSQRPETYLVPFLFAIIFIVGVLGNGTIIIIYIKHQSMRNIPNT